MNDDRCLAVLVENVGADGVVDRERAERGVAELDRDLASLVSAAVLNANDDSENATVSPASYSAGAPVGPVHPDRALGVVDGRSVCFAAR